MIVEVIMGVEPDGEVDHLSGFADDETSAAEASEPVAGSGIVTFDAVGMGFADGVLSKIRRRINRIIVGIDVTQGNAGRFQLIFQFA